ncbi:hypothetical protein GCM10018962_17740 [Dactylosporangium matsuzakiense]|uniref:Uncharacterized protein n=1 Tax=Dactylosporangium matsuzakiense TaxID=53360 RepID=A0A9W6NJU4_9ACTN|nr:hypothetical protein GCM10017581_011660 [Dactylosporangium matsuzakiense]
MLVIVEESARDLPASCREPVPRLGTLGVRRHESGLHRDGFPVEAALFQGKGQVVRSYSVVPPIVVAA